jgi:hypothetical protein
VVALLNGQTMLRTNGSNRVPVFVHLVGSLAFYRGEEGEAGGRPPKLVKLEVGAHPCRAQHGSDRI